MTRPLFPFVLLGSRPSETVGDTMEELKAETPQALTIDTRSRDFRAIDRETPRIPPAPGVRKVGPDDPKDSSATDGVESSQSGSQGSQREPEDPSVNVERESKVIPSSDADSPATPGKTEPPVVGSTPEKQETLISSSPLL